ncbi:MAG TPA: PQQ-binding-like beta-propeller repeat protein [Gemmataceae bacterium]|jgi:outer membrane protein assembly factor BamB
MGESTSYAPLAPVPQPGYRRPRVWPAVVIALLYWAFLKLPMFLLPGTMEGFMIAGIGTMVATVLFLVWWLFLSRLRWIDRIVGLVAAVAVGVGIWRLYHPTVQGPDAMSTSVSLQFNILPIVLSAWAVWMLVARSAARPLRLAGLVVVLALAFGSFTLLRFDGVTGGFSPEFSLRWKPTAEERLLAARAAEHLAAESVADAAAAPPLDVGPGDWPEFRGPARDGRRPGVRISTDWKAHPPAQVWRHPVGPGWGSFAAVGPRLFTQEQLGEFERVVCLDAATGKEVWAHADKARHTDGQSGAGPRATPTVHDGRVYALGATGLLNCLDAATGKKLWSHDILTDSGRDALPKDQRVPPWGFAASPLVVQGVVTVYAGGPEGKGVLAYKAATGEPAWHAGNAGPDPGHSYCSTQLSRIAGVEQLLVTDNKGMTSFNPADGKVLWEYEWDLGKEFNRVVQPAVVGDTDLLLGSGMGKGTRRVRVTRDGAGWKTEQVWESRAISPYFNDLVIHKGHLYGFHNDLLTCVNVETGKGTWKERGYGAGQVLLLPDQDLLVVVTEKGEVALVEANPERRTELARVQAVEGKTWNHPVVAHGKLYVRNGEEAVCYELAPAGEAVAGK